MEEECRDIGIIDGIDYTGLYQCSNTGLVRSLNYGRTGKIELLNQQQHKNGYLFVGLWKSMNNKCISVHRLVYETFVGEIPQGMQVNHINEDKTDNRLENLNLMTPKENINWGTANERRSKAHTGKFVSKETREKLTNHPSYSKSVFQIDKYTNKIIAEFPSIMEASRQTKINRRGILGCCGNKPHYNTAGGFKWKYAV